MATKLNVDYEVQRLQSYYSFLTPTELVKKYATSVSTSPTTTAEDREIASSIMDVLFNTSLKGIVSLEDMQATFSSLVSGGSVQLRDEFNKIIEIRADGLSIGGSGADRTQLSELFGTASTDTHVTNPTFKIGYILCNTPRLTLAVRDTSSVAAFLNSVPTVELSRAVPYLSINFKTGRPTLVEDGKYLSAPTVLRFLNGSAPVSSGSPDETMALATSNRDGKSPGFDHMGMEIFTSPVTMTPFSTEADPALRSTRIQDPFRPIMSVESLDIEVIPTIGVYQYKTANLNLVLHDKSRLAEVSDLVRPEAFGGGESKAGIQITYGWSHPDTVTTGNVYGTLINRMRVTEVFSIINSKFSMSPTGEVKISLALATKGAYDVHRAKILDKDLESESRELQRLVKRIKELRDQAGLRGTDAMKEVRVFQVLDVAESAERPDLKEFTKKVEEAIKTLRAMGEKSGKGKASGAQKVASELADDLQQLYTKPNQGGGGGLFGQIDRTVSSVIAKRFDYLARVSDPFLPTPEQRKKAELAGKPITFPWDDDLKKFNTDAPAGSNKSRRNALVSLGALLMTFVGPPVMAAQNVDEVQFVFYTFNDYAGLAGGQNLATLPVDLEYFRDIFQKLARQRRDPNFTLEEFTRIVAEHVVQNPRSVGYGMRSLYTVSTDTENDDALPRIEMAKSATSEAVANQMTRILAGKGGSFKFPILECYVETLPRRKVVQDGQLPENDPSYNIMRVHIYDKQCTPYEPVFDLLAAARGDQPNQTIDPNLPLLDRSPDDPKPSSQAIMRAMADYISQFTNAKTREEKARIRPPRDLASADARAPFLAGPNIVVPGAADRVREFLRETVPSVTYGSNLSAVKSAEVSTLQDAHQQSIFMTRAGATNPTQPNGSDLGGLPTTVMPTTVNLTVLGCPLLALMQQFFVDMGTNTTVDNVYYLTGLSHAIKAGSFESKMKMTPGEAYGKFKPIKEALNAASTLLKLNVPK